MVVITICQARTTILDIFDISHEDNIEFHVRQWALGLISKLDDENTHITPNVHKLCDFK